LLALALEKDSVGIFSRTRAATLLEINPIIFQSIGMSTPPAAVPQPIANMSSTFRFSMPVPGLEGMPYFLGVNITKFLEHFKELYNEY
jgi:hypothetical protein